VFSPAFAALPTAVLLDDRVRFREPMTPDAMRLLHLRTISMRVAFRANDLNRQVVFRGISFVMIVFVPAITP